MSRKRLLAAVVQLADQLELRRVCEEDLAGGRCGEMWGDVGRCGEMWRIGEEDLAGGRWSH